MPIATSVLVAGATVAGVGMQGYGMFQSNKASKQQAAANAAIAEQQRQQEALRMQNMQLEAGRKQREIIRTAQRTRAMSLTTATAQGASDSSALFGAYGQNSGATNNNLLGVDQGLQLGYQTFESNNIISGQQDILAKAGSMMAQGQGWSSLGGSIAGAAGGLGRLSGGFGMGSSTTANAGNSYTNLVGYDPWAGIR